MRYNIKGKTKYNIGDEIVYDDSESKFYYRGKIVAININNKVDSNGNSYTNVEYVFRKYYASESLTSSTYKSDENHIMALAEFNEMQKNKHLSYDDYINWLNTKDWWNKG